METSLDAFMCDMTHSDKSHDSFKCVTRRIPMCYMTRSFISSVSAVALMETWLIAALRDRTQSYQSRDSFKDWHDSFLCVAWLVAAVRDSTHFFAWLNSFKCLTQWLLCVTERIPLRDVTRWNVWHNSFLRVTWLVPWWNELQVSAVALQETSLVAALRDRTQSYQFRDSFKDVTWLIPMCCMTRSCFAWQHAFLCVT